MVLVKISQENHKQRVEKVRKILQSKNLKGMIFFNPKSLFYLTGFHHIPTERPIALLIPTDGEIGIFIPELEINHVKDKTPLITDIITYFEYPDEIHPMKHFAKALKERGFANSAIAADAPGAPGYWGYIGESLNEIIPKADISILNEMIMDMRLIKDKEEITLIKESCKWGNLAHQLLQEYTHVGATEIEVVNKACAEASKMLIKALGPEFEPYGGTLSARAGYRGQIGAGSAIPHATTGNIFFKKGDTLVTGASANIGGYNSELERTMFVGEPSEKQEKYFKIMLKAQNAALEKFGPNVKNADVDKAARQVFKEEGVWDLVQHHTGHAIGLEGHERPFLDIGSKEIMKPGMVYTCEPGIYIHGFAGFRHSDTILITEDGSEMLTYYPRELEPLIIYI
ncbi:MAG: aminopeptidase P family protein [Candidatus Heimdallarchaeota archaeon]|nr:aminopeptidase P family protein [Candidatus Heimdallarchaeota archaeon]